MDFLDCRGQTCPVPVLETKKLIEQQSPNEVRVAVDGEVPRDNVRRFLESRGYEVVVETEGQGYLVVGRAEVGESLRSEEDEKRIVVFIDSETFGRGDDELGRILMKSFVVTLKELTPLPWRVILVNGGVKLVSEASEFVRHFTELENVGVEILACGTCLDFFQLKDRMKAGRISNMYEIVSSLTESTSVLKP